MSFPPAVRALPRPFLTILANLAEAGGHGALDRHHRVIVGPQKHILPGDPGAWLRLVAAGLVAGEDGKLILTELGREVVAEYAAGLVRESV